MTASRRILERLDRISKGIIVSILIDRKHIQNDHNDANTLVGEMERLAVADRSRSGKTDGVVSSNILFPFGVKMNYVQALEVEKALMENPVGFLELFEEDGKGEAKGGTKTPRSQTAPSKFFKLIDTPTSVHSTTSSKSTPEGNLKELTVQEFFQFNMDASPLKRLQYNTRERFHVSQTLAESLPKIDGVPESVISQPMPWSFAETQSETQKQQDPFSQHYTQHTISNLLSQLSLDAEEGHENLGRISESLAWPDSPPKSNPQRRGSEVSSTHSSPTKRRFGEKDGFEDGGESEGRRKRLGSPAGWSWASVSAAGGSRGGEIEEGRGSPLKGKAFSQRMEEMADETEDEDDLAELTQRVGGSPLLLDDNEESDEEVEEVEEENEENEEVEEMTQLTQRPRTPVRTATPTPLQAQPEPESLLLLTSFMKQSSSLSASTSPLLFSDSPKTGLVPSQSLEESYSPTARPSRKKILTPRTATKILAPPTPVRPSPFFSKTSTATTPFIPPTPTLDPSSPFWSPSPSKPHQRFSKPGPMLLVPETPLSNQTLFNPTAAAIDAVPDSQIAPPPRPRFSDTPPMPHFTARRKKRQGVKRGEVEKVEEKKATVEDVMTVLKDLDPTPVMDVPTGNLAAQKKGLVVEKMKKKNKKKKEQKEEELGSSGLFRVQAREKGRKMKGIVKMMEGLSVNDEEGVSEFED
ncbi:hypothetical protein HDU97_000128 [Phlyctochytrium planicorne]|nr:hypothetical protein HDU97_000128 [Phlyctochytrium planicorne]